MNPRQRRGAILMLLAVIIGFGVFLSVTSYVSSVESQVGSRTTVFRASTAIDPYTPLSTSNLEAIEVPQRWSAPTTRLQMSQLAGRRAGFRIEPGTIVSSDMLLAPSALNPDEREIAINVNPVTGIGGRVKPGDRVDIYAVFADVNGLPKQVQVLVRNVRVVSIGGTQTVRKNDDKGITESSVLPVTLALEPNRALAVTYANAFAQEVRLVGLPTDVGTDRQGEKNEFDARLLGGRAVPLQTGGTTP
jgi:pilus assembly protein CpaB